MNDQVNPTPAWRPYADQVVQKLLAHRRHRALVANPLAALSNQDVEPYDLSELNLPATAGEAAAEAVPDAEAAATGQAPRATPDLSPRALSLVIRLAATLGSEAAMRAASTPGAITAIHGLTPDELEPARRIVTEAFLPQGMLVHDDLCRRRRETDGSALILLAPEIRGAASDRIARRRFGEALEEALNDHQPLLLLLSDTGMLPEALQQAALQGEASLMRLVSLSRDVLVAHLGHSHGIGAADEPAIRAALPPDRLLSAMPGTALLLALRAPDARGVVGLVSSPDSCRPHSNSTRPPPDRRPGQSVASGPQEPRRVTLIERPTRHMRENIEKQEQTMDLTRNHNSEISLMTKLQLCKALCASEASVDRWLRSDRTFPQPRRLGPGSIRWVRQEVDAFIRDLDTVAYDDHAFDPDDA
jgi:predicted DNA-binding transcriptional regulator AlpA